MIADHDYHCDKPGRSRNILEKGEDGILELISLGSRIMSRIVQR